MIRALAFDVFGTVVDWRGSLVAEGAERWEPRGWHADWGALADAWRGRYQPALERVRRGERPFTSLDVLHRESLDALLPEFGLEAMGDAERAELNLAWHRLRPWPDSRPGLERLAQHHHLTTLSNGNRSLLRDLVREGRLAFHQVLSAEDFGAYKPDPRVYLGAARRLELPPGEVAMVAAHPDDLRAAAEQGLRTCYVPRPLEWGGGAPVPEAGEEFDHVAPDLVALAEALAPVS